MLSWPGSVLLRKSGLCQLQSCRHTCSVLRLIQVSALHSMNPECWGAGRQAACPCRTSHPPSGRACAWQKTRRPAWLLSQPLRSPRPQAKAGQAALQAVGSRPAACMARLSRRPGSCPQAQSPAPLPAGGSSRTTGTGTGARTQSARGSLTRPEQLDKVQVAGMLQGPAAPGAAAQTYHQQYAVQRCFWNGRTCQGLGVGDGCISQNSWPRRPGGEERQSSDARDREACRHLSCTAGLVHRQAPCSEGV